MRLYADLLRADFETYIADVQVYFRCLDAERARAFTEARNVSEDYGRFQRAQDRAPASGTSMPLPCSRRR